MRTELVIAIGHPHHVLIHYNCWYLYDYRKEYPHGLPIRSYIVKR